MSRGLWITLAWGNTTVLPSQFKISISSLRNQRPRLKKTIANLSDGQKQSVAYRAKQLIFKGGIDSNRLIATLEKMPWH